jgi:phage repressor protein C with HTH and peptisase S24 domain
MKWWERLGRVVEARKLSVEEISARSGVPVKSVYGYINGDVENPRGDVIKRLAEAIGMSEQELRYGSGPQHLVTAKRIPLLDMHKLGKLKVGENPLSQWDGVSTAEVPVEIPEGCFAVLLADESMEPEFKKGSVIICDPNAPIIPGKYVVVVMPDSEDALFGRFRPVGYKDLRRFTLIRTGEDYPEIEFGAKVKGFIIARAIKHVRDI